MKNSIWILLLILGFLACNDDDVVFEPVTEGLEIRFVPVAGGAMMYYSLPNDRNIFAMNVRYKNWQGGDVLKVGDYGSDSLLLDGFTEKKEAIVAQVSFVNHRNEESAMQEYSFSTLNSAPWAFFEDLEVSSTWNGFQVAYQTPGVATGMAHVFYLGENPLTHQPDTIPVSSFPILQGGDTIQFEMDRKLEKYTVVVRTEDFQGYRVKQEIYPGIDAFLTEQWTVTADNFNVGGLSVENEKAKTGLKYLFDGDLKGKERMEFFLSTRDPNIVNTGHEVYGTFLAGPKAFEKPMVLDLKEQKTPAWLRLYALIPTQSKHAQGNVALGDIWLGWYDNKLPCKLSVYGHSTTADPNADGWVYLGGLDQNPKAETASDKWSYRHIEPTVGGIGLPKTWEEFNYADPMYVDVMCPVEDHTYRYLKIIIHGTFDTKLTPSTTPNTKEYITLHELEVYVKKN